MNEEQYEKMRKALCIIRAWAVNDNGKESRQKAMNDIAKLCDDALGKEDE